jgi:HisJ family histidinol phosphate phosphatase
MLYKTDYHVHTTFSDGKADPEEYVRQAISAGINEIGFSEHLNLFVADQWCMDPERTREYISHIRKLQKKYSGLKRAWRLTISRERRRKYLNLQINSISIT